MYIPLGGGKNMSSYNLNFNPSINKSTPAGHSSVKTLTGNALLIEEEDKIPLEKEFKPPSLFTTSHNNQQLQTVLNPQINNPEEVLDAQEDLRKFVDIQFMKKSVGSLHSFEFTILDYPRFNKRIFNAMVIARAQARDKFILVAALKKKGNVVAVTGDGVSDSLAMRTAHVGISMGYRSSDMSKEAADIILMDNNFKSILTAVIHGRNI